MSQQTPKYKLYPELNVDIILASFFGLIGEVSPALRSLCIDWDNRCIFLYFYYDGNISEEDHESAECIATDIIANFSTHILEIKIIRLDYPSSPIPESGILIYQRCEPLFEKKINERRKLIKKTLIDSYRTSIRVKVFLSLILGLLGNISAVLRGLKIQWNEQLIRLYFYYDGAISEKDHNTAEHVKAEMISDFPEHELEINTLRWDYPKPIPQEDLVTVYHRREKNPNS